MSKHHRITQNELHISPEAPLHSYTSAAACVKGFFFRGGRLWISVTWSPLASRHMTPGTAEDKAHLKDTEKEMEGWGGGDCGANVRFHRHWGMLSVGTGMQRTHFPLRTRNSLSSPNSSISTSKMKHTPSRCLSHHLESCTPLQQLCIVTNQYEVLCIHHTV